MKNLFITLLLLVSSQLFAQQELNGSLKSNDVMICTYSGDLTGDFILTRLK